MIYADFLRSKERLHPETGLVVNSIHPTLYPFQQAITKWALRLGRACIFADCGLGKTLMQLEWARKVSEHTKGTVLILAPLAVAEQTIREAEKIGVAVHHSQQGELAAPITITNYERLHYFDTGKIAGVVLDESSILKSYTGKIRDEILRSFASTPYRLACTATPAPNDYMELGNHSEFVGALSRNEMLATFFTHDGGDTRLWRLRRHAEKDFWKWLCSWAVMVKKPSDIGFCDDGFDLPELKIHQHIISADDSLLQATGSLFALEANTLQERRQAKRESMKHRVSEAANIINSNKGQWLVWCELNAEGDALEQAISGSVQVAGADTPEHKTDSMLRFSRGEIDTLISKPSICGFGMNFQNCHQMLFVGLSDSYEQFYQSIRRCWRFGQHKQVDVHIVIGEQETSILRNVKRKEQDAERMSVSMVNNMHNLQEENIQQGNQVKKVYSERTERGERFTVYNADCIEAIQQIKDDSVHFTIFSPPFASLYTYSSSERDMGNCGSQDEFLQHFSYLVEELLRVTIPGRLCSVHCMNLPAMKFRDGYIGLTDFRGDLIRLFTDKNWIYHSEVTIWKDPVTQMQRTKALGLLHKQIKKNSAMCRMGLPDYLVTFRKGGDTPEPVSHPNGLSRYVGENLPPGGLDSEHRSIEIWQRYASPVWFDINPSKTLQFTTARDPEDERHICPLQLDVIERAIELWTNPMDMVFSPFMGIGSEGWCALRSGRKFTGIELKETYFRVALKNLIEAEKYQPEESLF